MIKSIQHYQTEGVKKLEDIFVSYSSNLSKIAEMVEGVTKSVVELGCSMIAEEWEFYDVVLRERSTNLHYPFKLWLLTKLVYCDKLKKRFIRINQPRRAKAWS